MSSRASSDATFMRLALRLARRALGRTSPNPIVGALLVRDGRILGRGWHRSAGGPHAEIEALRDAQAKGNSVRGATLYVTLEPCSTFGRTPPCTDALIRARIRRAVVGATDPNPKHAGRAFALLRRAGVQVESGVLAEECLAINEPFNHWIVHGTPLVTVKAAMTLDGKIATAAGESKWITGPQARAYGMRLRARSDAVLVGINTVLADDPKLTVRLSGKTDSAGGKPLRRIILDGRARTPLEAHVAADEHASWTTVVVSSRAPTRRVEKLARRVNVLRAPVSPATAGISIGWLLEQLGRMDVTSLLVEGGGEVNASFLLGGFAQRIAFFYAPKVLGGRESKAAVAGKGAGGPGQMLRLKDPRWRRLGEDWLLEALVAVD